MRGDQRDPVYLVADGQVLTFNELLDSVHDRVLGVVFNISATGSNSICGELKELHSITNT